MKARSTVLAASAMLLLALAALPAAAQGGQMEAKGTITDHEGNPIEGILVKYRAESNTALEYTGKTNKKGRYYIPGLFTAKEGDMWVIEVVTDDWVTMSMYVESRTANRTLIGDPRTVPLGPRKKIPSIVIRPLGDATVDFTMAPPDIAASLMGTPASAEPAETAKAPAQPQQDPYDQALTLASEGDLEGSLPFFAKGIEKKPEDATRHRTYAQVLYKLEYYDQAAVEGERALELDDQDIQAYLVLYTVRIGQGNMAGAREALEAARAIDPKNLDLLRQVAYVAGAGGDADEQIAAHRAIVEVAPNETASWLALGDLYAREGRTDESEAAYEKVVELDPTNADQVFFNLGALIMNDSGRSEADVQKAITAFRKAVELNPKYGIAYRELGLALLNVGDRSGARTALEKYVQVAPKAPDAAQMQALIKALPAA